MSQAADSQSSGSTESEDNSSGIVITNAPQSEPSRDTVDEDSHEPTGDAPETSADAVDENTAEEEAVSAEGGAEAVESSNTSVEDSESSVDEEPVSEGEMVEVVQNEVEDDIVSGPEDGASSTENATAAEPEASSEVKSDSSEVDDSQAGAAEVSEESTNEAEEADSATGDNDMSETKTETKTEQSNQNSDFTGVDGDVDSPPREFDAIVEASTLKDAIDSVGVLVDECKIRTSQSGIQIRAVDPANVGMVDLTLAAPAFESLNTEEGVLGISWDRFESVVGLANNGDLVHLDYDYETRKLNVEINGLSYTLALIDPDSIRAEPDIPNLDLPAEVTVEGSHISRGVKAADMVSDHIRLSADDAERTFRFSAEGDTDDVDLVLDSDDIVAFGAVAPADSLFSLDYMKDMNKAIPKTAEVTMEVGEEFPIKLHFGFSDGYGKTTYMLAPRIQSD